MKLSSTIIFVPLTAALPAIPSTIYTSEQLTAITAHPNAREVGTAETGTMPQSDTYKRDETPAAKVTRDIALAANTKEPIDTSRAQQVQQRAVAATINGNGVTTNADEDSVTAVKDATPNTQYPGAAEIEAREVETAKEFKPDGKLSMRKRLVRLAKRVETNRFCPDLH